MILDEAHKDFREGPKTANSPDTLSMENSSESSVTASLSEVPTASSSEVASATSASEIPKRLHSLDVLNSSVSDVPDRRKSNHPETAQINESINSEHTTTEDVHLLVSHRQWKELCSNFFLPILLFGFIVLGLQFTSSLYMTAAGQTWYRYSAFLFFMVFCTGFVTELSYEELGLR